MKSDNEYMTEQEANEVKMIFQKYLKQYKEKEDNISDQEWLENLFISEMPEISIDEARCDAKEVVESIKQFDRNLEEVNIAAKDGKSKERWLSEKLQEFSVGRTINDYGKILQSIDDFLYQKNVELAENLTRAVDGHIKMSPNLDGNIAENMIANTSELSAFLQGKNIRVEVRDAFTKNSVDVRVWNMDTGRYQNYQLKFGKDAKTTIELIERGNYNNQRIIVPAEQLEMVQEYFKQKGSNKTISDHIEVWGIKGKKFTKADVKELQNLAQNEGIMPDVNYSHYQTKELAMSIGKNAGVMALQAAAITTGMDIAYKIMKNEKIDSDELVEVAVNTGVDTSVKVITAGTLQVAIRKGIISVIPKATPAGMIANLACVGIENVKILSQIATGELTLTRGVEQIGRTTTSMVGGLLGMTKGAVIGAELTAWLPVIGAPMAVVSGFVGGMVGYFGGAKIGETVYNAGKQVAKAIGNVAKTAFNGIKSGVPSIANGIKSFAKSIFG